LKSRTIINLGIFLYPYHSCCRHQTSSLHQILQRIFHMLHDLWQAYFQVHSILSFQYDPQSILIDDHVEAFHEKYLKINLENPLDLSQNAMNLATTLRHDP